MKFSKNITAVATLAAVLAVLAGIIVPASVAAQSSSAFVVPCSASNCWNIYGTVYYTVPSLAGPTDALVVTQDGNQGQVRVECPNSTTTGCADLVPGQWVVIKGGIYGAVGSCVDGPQNEVQAVDVWRWTGSAWQFYDKEQQAWVAWP